MPPADYQQEWRWQPSHNEDPNAVIELVRVHAGDTPPQ
jgi:hypothetical protein